MDDAASFEAASHAVGIYVNSDGTQVRVRLDGQERVFGSAASGVAERAMRLIGGDEVAIFFFDQEPDVLAGISPLFRTVDVLAVDGSAAVAASGEQVAVSETVLLEQDGGLRPASVSEISQLVSRTGRLAAHYVRNIDSGISRALVFGAPE